MDIPVKYRGIDTTGIIIYGNAIYDCSKFCKEFSDKMYIVDGAKFHLVYRYSLMKLAGYDNDGNEVYRSLRK